MKNFFRKLGFHKMDEMEQSIMFKAQRNAFLFLEFALIFWSLYESYKVLAYHTHLNIVPSMFAMVAMSIQYISQLIITHNAVKGDDETPNASPLFKTILLIIVFAVVIIAVGNFVIFWVMK